LNERIQILLSGQVPAWGVGRVDTFNPYKAIQFNWDLKALPKEQLTGASDFPSLWNQRPRDGMQLHWDGNNNSVDERNLSAALGAGVTPVTVDHPRLERVRNWIWTLPPPKYPYEIDPVLAAKGRDLYSDHCGSCHDFDGSEVGRVEPIGEINTDPRRLNSYTYTFAANQYTLYPDSKYRFVHFRKTNGYANQPLDGIWARAPYLHNGSVPTLRDLLEPPEKRLVSSFVATISTTGRTSALFRTSPARTVSASLNTIPRSRAMKTAAISMAPSSRPSKKTPWSST
jgi:hypothetical protein